MFINKNNNNNYYYNYICCINYLCLKVLCWSSPRCTKMTLIHQKICKGTKLLVYQDWHHYWCDVINLLNLIFFSCSVCVCVCWCRTLEREELRKLYVSPPVPAENTPLVYPETGQPWIGRRIDYILYRENSISKHCRTVRVFLLFTLFSLSSLLLSLLDLLDATNSFKTKNIA